MDELIPEDFPKSTYEAIMTRVLSLREPNQETYKEFFGSWNALRYRYIALAEADDEYRAAFDAGGDAPHQPSRYHQERDLFRFFVEGLSVIETFCYGLYSICSMLDPSKCSVATDEKKYKVKPHFVKESLQAHFSEDRITAVLTSCLESEELRGWKKVRNVLAHRGHPGRIISMSVGGSIGSGTGSVEDPTPSHWFSGVDITQETTSTRRRWLAEILKELLDATDALVSLHVDSENSSG